jgi:hypothetical protein
MGFTPAAQVLALGNRIEKTKVKYGDNLKHQSQTSDEEIQTCYFKTVVPETNLPHSVTGRDLSRALDLQVSPLGLLAWNLKPFLKSMPSCSFPYGLPRPASADFAQSKAPCCTLQRRLSHPGW